MKREEIKVILENAEMDVEAKLKAIMDSNGKDLNELKATNKTLEEKVKDHDDLQAKFDELSKQVDTMKEFEEKAKKFDEINPKYEEVLKVNKDNEFTNKIKGYKFDDKFVKFIKSEMAETKDEEMDEALKKYAEDHPEFLTPNPKPNPAPELGKGKGKGDDEDLSKIF